MGFSTSCVREGALDDALQFAGAGFVELEHLAHLPRHLSIVRAVGLKLQDPGSLDIDGVVAAEDWAVQSGRDRWGRWDTEVRSAGRPTEAVSTSSDRECR
jgi:hypothetical protein